MSNSLDPNVQHEARVEDVETVDREELLAEIGSLELQNRQLRERYNRYRRETYRETALALVGVGVLAFGGAIVFPEVRELLIALGATGVFAAALTYFVTPEQFIPATIGEHVYDAFATNTAALVHQLDLSGPRVYVPTEGTPGVRLFVPQYDDFVLPSPAELTSPLVVADEERKRGVALVPVGAFLFDEFEQSLSEPLELSPERVAPQLRDGLTETFEFAQRVEVTTDRANGSASFGIVDSRWAEIERIDHPISSFIGAGFAHVVDGPAEVTVVPEHEEQYDGLVRVEWEQVETDSG